jgi:hypothetical protein
MLNDNGPCPDSCPMECCPDLDKEPVYLPYADAERLYKELEEHRIGVFFNLKQRKLEFHDFDLPLGTKWKEASDPRRQEHIKMIKDWVYKIIGQCMHDGKPLPRQLNFPFRRTDVEKHVSRHTDE